MRLPRLRGGEPVGLVQVGTTQVVFPAYAGVSRRRPECR